MAYLDVDFVVPIMLLVGSLVGVMLVRFAAARGERAAKVRTGRLIEEARIEETGMAGEDRASSE